MSDPVVAAVCADLLARSALGIAKYGTTLAREDLSPAQWQRHLYEELLDAACYLRRQMDGGTSIAGHASADGATLYGEERA